ncbi:uncharacterized protein LOC111085184 [Limulus polyphemus]|uniref:Uncharacterized protein LOC111085184 n=1 Tax=Limulus polyphemus TaxID=6850 RepID=A0ABM1S412_LIMPO|nr:uncharacterized protein LOC111085184 [Limulus polyphemus]
MPQDRRPSVPLIRCKIMRKNKYLDGLLMAGPFIICFVLFGTMNLIAGTFLTLMAYKSRLPMVSSTYSEDFLKSYSEKMEHLFDPLKIVGPILLVTGFMLLVIGLLLGTIACKSSVHAAWKEPRLSPLSCFQLSHMNDSQRLRLQVTSNTKRKSSLCPTQKQVSRLNPAFLTTLDVTADVHISPCTSRTDKINSKAPPEDITHDVMAHDTAGSNIEKINH